MATSALPASTCGAPSSLGAWRRYSAKSCTFIVRHCVAFGDGVKSTVRTLTCTSPLSRSLRVRMSSGYTSATATTHTRRFSLASASAIADALFELEYPCSASIAMLCPSMKHWMSILLPSGCVASSRASIPASASRSQRRVFSASSFDIAFSIPAMCAPRIVGAQAWCDSCISPIRRIAQRTRHSQTVRDLA